MTHKKSTGPTPETGAHHSNTHTAIFTPAEKLRNKQEANCIAQLALNGYSTRRVEGGGYYVSRWNLAKFCRDLGDLEQFAAEVAK
jgi:hypothetical protein